MTHFLNYVAHNEFNRYYSRAIYSYIIYELIPENMKNDFIKLWINILP